MDSLAQPLRKLYEDAGWFARARELKLLHVQCSSTLRDAALRVLAATEFHADNRSPFVVLAETHTVADDGWETRSKRIVKHWDERFAASMLDGLELGELEQRAPTSSAPLVAFGVWLARVLDALRPPLKGLVVVLAPTRVEDAASFERDLTELVARRELRAVRWMVLELGNAPLGGLIASLGSAALSCRCAEDTDALDRDLATIAGGMDPVANGPARSGAAWPRGILPPSRPGERTPTRAQEEQRDLDLAAAGINVVLAGPDGTRMKQHMLLASVAARKQASADAFTHQLAATRIAYDAGATREALLQHLVLAGYYHSFGHVPEAEREYATVAQRAEEWGCALETAQAHLALALFAALGKRHAEAAEHYSVAAVAAQRADALTMAIECWRLAGQLAVELGLETRAIECWRRAIELVHEGTVELAKASSAPEAARQLARLLRSRGLHAQADALDLQANRLQASGSPILVEVG
ncbi:MAG: hypothetical protein K8H88_06200 [Sandaracinaceae bacterium]|nr:hypothetical protein [Sandaracinaceae bacterium]